MPRSVIFQILHFPAIWSFWSVIFRCCKCSCPGDRSNVCSCRGLQTSATATEASLKVNHRWCNKASASAAAVPKVYEVHRTRLPFHLMATYRNFCSPSCRGHWDCQDAHTHATVKSSAASSKMSFSRSVLSMRLFKTLTEDDRVCSEYCFGCKQVWSFVSPCRSSTWCFRPKVLMPQNFLKADVRQHNQRHLMFLPRSARTRFHFRSLLFSVFRPKSGSSCRHSVLSAFCPKMRSAFRPFGIPTASQLQTLVSVALDGITDVKS